MADQIKKLSAGHSIEVLDAIMTEVEEARGEYESLDARLDEISGEGYSKAEVDALLALKQNVLNSAQLAAVNSGIDSTKVSQIETNKNNILTDEAALVELVDGGAKNIADFTSTTKTIYTTATSNGVTIARNGDIFTISGTSNTNNNIFFNIYYDGSTSTKMIPPGNWVALIEDYTGSVVKDIAVQPCVPAAHSKIYGIPFIFSLSGSESGNWIRINLRPSTTYDGSFRLMICTKAAWDISQTYQPYRPTYQELYEMVLALQSGSARSLSAELSEEDMR